MFFKAWREGYAWKKERCWGVDSPGWSICRVGFALDIYGVEGVSVFMFLNEHVNMFKDVVDLRVPAPPIPLSFNDAFVVTIDEKVSWLCDSAEEEPCKQLKADSLSPANVSSPIEFPSGDEAPCSPPVANNNSNANAQACIRECPSIVDR